MAARWQWSKGGCWSTLGRDNSASVLPINSPGSQTTRTVCNQKAGAGHLQADEAAGRRIEGLAVDLIVPKQKTRAGCTSASCFEATTSGTSRPFVLQALQLCQLACRGRAARGRPVQGLTQALCDRLLTRPPSEPAWPRLCSPRVSGRPAAASIPDLEVWDKEGEQ